MAYTSTLTGVQIDGALISSSMPVGLSDLQAIAADTYIDGYVFTTKYRTTDGDGGGGSFRWDGSDLSTEVTADTQSGIYVAPNSDATGASGAWVRQYIGAVNVEWFGAVGDGVTDDTAALKSAFVYDDIIIQDGTYIVSPTEELKITLFGSAANGPCVFVMHSNLHITGLGSVTIKLVDGYSSVSSPGTHTMFASNTDDTNVSFKNIIFDMNGQNNLIAASDAVRPFGIFLCSSILWATNPDTLQGTVDGLIIEDCVFKNSPGTNQIVLGFYTLGYQKPCNNVAIKRCQFFNNGFNTSDFSQINVWADHVLIEDCTFLADPDAQDKTTGIAAELHGSYVTFRNNYVYNMPFGVLPAENDESGIEGIYVYGNYFEVYGWAIALFNDAASSAYIKNVHLYDNDVVITNYDIPINNLRRAIRLTTPGYVTDVFCHNNIISYAYEGTSNLHVGIAIYDLDETGYQAGRISVYDNTLTGNFYNGIWCETDNTGKSIETVNIKNNQITTVAAGKGPGLMVKGGSGSDGITNVNVRDNIVLSPATTVENIAIYGKMTNVFADGNYASGATTPLTYSPTAPSVSVGSDAPWATDVITATCGTSGSIDVAEAFNTLAYVKIGNVVTVNGRIYLTATSGVGTLTLNNILPFPAKSLPDDEDYISFNINYADLTNPCTLGLAGIVSGTSVIVQNKTALGMTSSGVSEFIGSNAKLIFNFSYIAKM
jgi:hypothetical protein